MATQKEKRQYKANLAGKNYIISGQASLPHFKAVETLLNKEWQQIKVVAPKISTMDQAMLLTFNALSDQLYKQAEVDNLKKQVVELEKMLAAREQPTKPATRRESKSAIGSIIDHAKQDSQVRSTNKLFKQGTSI